MARHPRILKENLRRVASPSEGCLCTRGELRIMAMALESAGIRGMGWSIYYRVRNSRRWSSEDEARLVVHHDAWRERFSALCGYDVSGLPHSTDFQGATKPPPSPRIADDYPVLIAALRELEELFPGVEVTVSDDSGLVDGLRPQDIDLAGLRASLVEIWGADPAELETDPHDPEGEAHAALHFDDDVEDREVARLLQKAKRPLLESAAKDFAIWKNSQKNRKP